MKINNKAIFNIIFLTAFIFLIYKIRITLIPFFLAILISYSLNPAVNFLSKKLNFSRLSAVSIVMIIFLCLFVGFFIFFIPKLYKEAIIFLGLIPDYIKNFSDSFYDNLIDLLARFNIKIEPNFLDLVTNNANLLFQNERIEKVITSLINSTNFIINLLSVIFIMPILIFYFLKDWQKIINKIYDNFPQEYLPRIQEILSIIRKSFAVFIRGQLNICLILSFYYVFFLKFVDLNNAFLIGLITGFLSFIPYLGYGIGISLALLSSLFQWGISCPQITAVVLIYLFGQIIESNFLVPNLIGKKINLHPLWIIFGIFFFGALFGFMGLLLSMPLTITSSAIIKYFIKNYK